ncbi:MAG: ATP-binding protein [Chthoniobacteraceae bacterium]
MDYIALVLGALVLFGFLHRLFWRGRPSAAMPTLIWLLVAAVLGGGWFFVESSARHEWVLMRRMVEGYAPTFAIEMRRLGHQQITAETPADDPRYWQLLEAEKRWLTVNPSISDIYTLRKTPDGRVALIVDSETDYNHNGAFEGEREQRTKIGTIYESEVKRVIDSVLAGKPIFLDAPYTNRWGTWVSSVVPIRDLNGNIEAALGVDFDATTWLAAMTRARQTAIAYIGLLLLVIAGAGTVVAHQITTRELQVQLQDQTDVSIEKQQLETLVNSIDGIVWESDAATFRFTFVSRQSERLLGYPPEEWMAKEDFWKSKLHHDDLDAASHRAKMVAAKAPYSYDYRMIAADGRTIWIRENAAVLLGPTGDPLLVRGVLYDITAQKRAAEELEQANAALVDSSRFAGMAEVATGVLHNVGNVLNSVNVSGNVISERLRRSKVIELGKVAGLLTLQAADFAGFVARDPRGPHVPELISCVADALKAEHADLLEEVESITRNIAHIKEIVAMQQGFAKGGGIIEPLTIQTLVDDAIKINSVSFARHHIAVVQAYEEVPKVLVDKHLVLQILVNLLRNAKQAIQEAGTEPRRIVVKIQSKGTDFVKVAVQDTGTGIPQDNLTRIFSHGFTTKKTGHGFGLHSSALAATGMGGSLNAQSDGPGTGATFILELPVYQALDVAAAA